MKNWEIKSLDVMQLTKNSMTAQLTDVQIIAVVSNLAKYSPTHIAISVPMNEGADYDDIPVAGYLERWVTAIRNANLKIWWRPTWIEFEKGDGSGTVGLYGADRLTPTSATPRSIGVASTVLDGSDTTSYL